jgi:hypothetical protein
VPSKDWITDAGDYYTIQIPAGKTLINEFFNKPCLVLFGENASMMQCFVDGFVNVYAQRCASIVGCSFDMSGKALISPRPVLSVLDYKENINIIGCHIKGDPWTPSMYLSSFQYTNRGITRE